MTAYPYYMPKQRLICPLLPTSALRGDGARVQLHPGTCTRAHGQVGEHTLEGGVAEAGRPDSVDAQHGPQPAWDADVAAGDAAMEEGER